MIKIWHHASFVNNSRTNEVTIVKKAAILGDKSFSLNPVIINSGSTIRWTNTDNIVHTVTSGEPNSVNAGELFDSGLTALISTVPDFIAFCDIDCPKKLRNGRKDFNMSKNLFALHKNGPDNNINIVQKI